MSVDDFVGADIPALIPPEDALPISKHLLQQCPVQWSDRDGGCCARRFAGFPAGRGDVSTGPLAAWPPTADVAIVPWTRNERAATAGAKTTSYADNVIALRHAHDGWRIDHRVERRYRGIGQRCSDH